MVECTVFEYEIGVQLPCTTPFDYLIMRFVCRSSVNSTSFMKRDSRVGFLRTSISVSIGL
jgi:hypothetical protein